MSSVHGKSMPDVQKVFYLYEYFSKFPEQPSNQWISTKDMSDLSKGFSSEWLRIFGATQAQLLPEQGFIERRTDELQYDRSKMKLIIPVLAGKSWTCEVGAWFNQEGYPWSVGKAFYILGSASGYGDTVKLEHAGVMYMQAVSLAFHYDNEVLVIPELYIRKLSLSPVANMEALWADP